MMNTLDQQLADLCAIHGLEAITINSYAPKDRPGHVSVCVHRNGRVASDDLYTGTDITAAFKRAMERLNEVHAPDFAPMGGGVASGFPPLPSSKAPPHGVYG